MGSGDKHIPQKLKKGFQAKSAERRKRNSAETRLLSAQSSSGRNDLQPSLRTVISPIDDLKPAPNRTRITLPDQLERVMISVKRYGIVLPILIDAEGRIVAGHALWEAGKKLGLEEIECRIVDHLSPLELEALTLTLNRLGETGTYDLELLRERLVVLKAGGIELVSTGFTIPEIDQILIDPAPVQESETDSEEEQGKDPPPVSVTGDLYELGEHRLLCGDALEESSYHRVLAGRKAQGVFSDPPYNCKIEGFVSGLGSHKHSDFQMASGEMDDAEFTQFLRTYLAHCLIVTSKGAIIFACIDWRQAERLLEAGREAGLARVNVVVWDKGSGGMGSLYRSAYELIAVFCNGSSPTTNNVELGVHGRSRTNVWSYPGANRTGSSSAKALADHPTPKPVELVEDALLDVTNPGDVVLDPFVGSGTTLIAAEKCGRNACGIELDPIYVDRTIRRWEALTGRRAVHVETGLTFEELAESRRDNAAE